MQAHGLQSVGVGQLVTHQLLLQGQVDVELGQLGAVSLCLGHDACHVNGRAFRVGSQGVRRPGAVVVHSHLLPVGDDLHVGQLGLRDGEICVDLGGVHLDQELTFLDRLAGGYQDLAHPQAVVRAYGRQGGDARFDDGRGRTEAGLREREGNRDG